MDIEARDRSEAPAAPLGDPVPRVPLGEINGDDNTGRRSLSSPVSGIVSSGHDNRNDDDSSASTAVQRAPLSRQSAEEDEHLPPSPLPPKYSILPAAAGTETPRLPSENPSPTTTGASARGGDGDDQSSFIEDRGAPASPFSGSSISHTNVDDSDRIRGGARASRPLGGTASAGGTAALAVRAEESPDLEGYREGARARQTGHTRQWGTGGSGGTQILQANQPPVFGAHDQAAKEVLATDLVDDGSLAAATQSRRRETARIPDANMETSAEAAKKLPEGSAPLPVVPTKDGEDGGVSSFLDAGRIDSPSASSAEGGGALGSEGEEDEVTARRKRAKEQQEEEEEEAWRRRQRRRRRQQRKKSRKGDGRNGLSGSSSSRRDVGSGDVGCGGGGGGGGGSSLDSHRPSLLGPVGSTTLAPLKRTPPQLRMGSGDAAPGVHNASDPSMLSGVGGGGGGVGSGGGGGGGGGGGDGTGGDESARGEGRPDLRLERYGTGPHANIVVETRLDDERGVPKGDGGGVMSLVNG